MFTNPSLSHGLQLGTFTCSVILINPDSTNKGLIFDAPFFLRHCAWAQFSTFPISLMHDSPLLSYTLVLSSPYKGCHSFVLFNNHSMADNTQKDITQRNIMKALSMILTESTLGVLIWYAWETTHQCGLKLAPHRNTQFGCICTLSS